MGYNQAFASFTGRDARRGITSRWSGGSSSGSGAAVSAGLVPFAIGSETWGSIQFPAAFCGVTGLRPTYGRVSRHGAMALSWTMDKLGPLARTAEDCGLVLAAIAGPDPDDATTISDALAAGTVGSQRRFRFGILKGTLDKTQPEVRKNFEDSLSTLREMGDIVDDLVLPDYPYDAMAGLIIEAEAASAFEPLFESGRITRLTAPEDRIGGYAGQVVLAKDYIRALRLRRPAAAALHGLLAGVDAVRRPVAPDRRLADRHSVRQGLSRLSREARTSPAPPIVAGVPGLFLMNGVGERGLPTSLQLTGAAGTEAVLLAAGAAYQARTTHHRMRPPGL